MHFTIIIHCVQYFVDWFTSSCIKGAYIWDKVTIEINWVARLHSLKERDESLKLNSGFDRKL